MWDTANVTRLRPDAEKIISVILANKQRYLAVEKATGAPWWLVAVIHAMEASCRFDRHLHNGDKLTGRTVNVPKGRPKTHNGPFSWEESAIDAVLYKKLNSFKDLTIPELLYKLEQYNGWGYRNKGIATPYLWSGTDKYKAGKYVADGKYSPTAVSKQPGCVVLLKSLSI